MLCHFSCKSDISGGGPVPEKSQILQSITACAKKTFQPRTPLSPSQLLNPSQKKAQWMKLVQLLNTSKTIVSQQDSAGGKPISEVSFLLLSSTHSFLSFPHPSWMGEAYQWGSFIHWHLCWQLEWCRFINKAKQRLRKGGRVSVLLDHFTEPVWLWSPRQLDCHIWVPV